MTTYKDAGVDIEKTDNFIRQLKEDILTTHSENVLSINGFAGLYDVSYLKEYTKPIMLTATDGVGTKLELARHFERYDTIGIDLVAMVVNDIVVHGGTPKVFLDYFATGKFEEEQAKKIIKGIITGCKLAGCSLVGGETAEMPGMYPNGQFDLAGFSVGFVEEENILPKKIFASNVLIALPSSGLHSNGYSLIRHLNKTAGLELFEELIVPTRIYVKECLSVAHLVNGFVHITGGGFSNISRILPDELTYTLNHWEFPDLFKNIQFHAAISNDEMKNIFNCGIGMIIISSMTKSKDILNILSDSFIIGEVVKKDK